MVGWDGGIGTRAHKNERRQESTGDAGAQTLRLGDLPRKQEPALQLPVISSFVLSPASHDPRFLSTMDPSLSSRRPSREQVARCP